MADDCLTTALAGFQAALGGLYDQRATIQRNAGDDQWVTLASAVPCLCSASKAQIIVVAGQVRSVTRWAWDFPAGTDLRPTDRVVVAGRTFEVMARTDPPEQALEVQIEALEVTPHG